MYTISHIPVPRMCTSNRTCLSYVFLFFHFLFIFILPKTRVRAIVHTFLMFVLFIPGVRLPDGKCHINITFRDTLHFTITTTTTTMTTPTTKPPPPPPRAQTRPPPFQEQTGLETQLRLESQVYFFSFFFCFFFFALLTGPQQPTEG